MLRSDLPGRGHLVDIDEDSYHAEQTRSSNSAIGRFLTARREYVAEYVTRTRKRSTTPALAFGRLFHAMLLDPVDLQGRFCVPPTRREVEPHRYADDDPDGDKRAHGAEKAGKAALAEFRLETVGRTEVDPVDARFARVMADALRAHEQANNTVFAAEGLREQSAAWTDEETGKLMRCRWDLVFPEQDLIVDLKTFSSRAGEDLLGDPHAFASHCDRYGYHRQAAVYLDAYYAVYRRNARLAFVFVEKHAEPRVSVQYVETDSPAAQVGRLEYRQGLAEIAECERTGDWRVPAERGVVGYALPEWKQRKYEYEEEGRADFSGVQVA